MTMGSIFDSVEELRPRLVTDNYDATSVNEALAKFVTYFDRNKQPFGGTIHCNDLAQVKWRHWNGQEMLFLLS